MNERQELRTFILENILPIEEQNLNEFSFKGAFAGLKKVIKNPKVILALVAIATVGTTLLALKRRLQSMKMLKQDPKGKRIFKEWEQLSKEYETIEDKIDDLNSIVSGRQIGYKDTSDVEVKILELSVKSKKLENRLKNLEIQMNERVFELRAVSKR